MFDIDGVFVRGKEVFSHSTEALELLIDRNGKFKIPTVFVTNAGNTLRSKKADQLSERLGIKVSLCLLVALSVFNLCRSMIAAIIPLINANNILRS